MKRTLLFLMIILFYFMTSDAYVYNRVYTYNFNRNGSGTWILSNGSTLNANGNFTFTSTLITLIGGSTLNILNGYTVNSNVVRSSSPDISVTSSILNINGATINLNNRSCSSLSCGNIKTFENSTISITNSTLNAPNSRGTFIVLSGHNDNSNLSIKDSTLTSRGRSIYLESQGHGEHNLTIENSTINSKYGNSILSEGSNIHIFNNSNITGQVLIKGDGNIHIENSHLQGNSRRSGGINISDSTSVPGAATVTLENLIFNNNISAAITITEPNTKVTGSTINISSINSGISVDGNYLDIHFSNVTMDVSSATGQGLILRNRLGTSLVIENSIISAANPLYLLSYNSAKLELNNVVLNITYAASSIDDALNSNYEGFGVFFDGGSEDNIPILNNVTINMKKDNQVGIFLVKGGTLQIGKNNTSETDIFANEHTTAASVIIGQYPYFGSSTVKSTLKVLGFLTTSGNVDVYESGNIQLGDTQGHSGAIQGNIILLDNSYGMDVYNQGSLPKVDYDQFDPLDHGLTKGSIVDGDIVNDGGKGIVLHDSGTGGVFIVTGSIHNNVSTSSIDFGDTANNHLAIQGNYNGTSTLHMNIDSKNETHDSMYVKGDVHGTHNIRLNFISHDTNLASGFLMKVDGTNDAKITIPYHNAGPFVFDIIKKDVVLHAQNDSGKTLHITEDDFFVATLETNDDKKVCLTYKKTFYCSTKLDIKDILDEDVIYDGKVLLSKAFFMPLFTNSYLYTIFHNSSSFNYKKPQAGVHFSTGWGEGDPWLTSSYSYYTAHGKFSMPLMNKKTIGGVGYAKVIYLIGNASFIHYSYQTNVGTQWIWRLGKLNVEGGIEGGFLNTKVQLQKGLEENVSYNESLSSLTANTFGSIKYPLWNIYHVQFLGKYIMNYSYIGSSQVDIDDLKAVSSDTTVHINPANVLRNSLQLTMNLPLRFTVIGEGGLALGKVTMHIPPVANTDFSLNGGYYKAKIQWELKPFISWVEYKKSLYDQSIAWGIGTDF